jgi:predicted outer membrane repeat protein
MKYLNFILIIVIIALLGYNSNDLHAQTYPSGPYILRWSPDGTKIAGVGANYLQVWNGTTGAMLADLSFAYPPVEGLPNFVSPASWSPDSTRFVTTSGDGFVRIWDAIQYEVIYQTSQFTNSLIASVEWHPNGQYIMIGGVGSDTSYLLDANTKEIIKRFNLGLVYGLAWKPKANEFVIAYSDVIYGAGTGITDPNSSATISLLSAYEDGVRSLAWSHNGNFLAVGYNNGTLLILDAINNVEYARLQGREEVEFSDLSFNSDDSVLISAQGSVMKVWSVTTRQLLANYQPIFGIAQASPVDSDRLAIANWKSGELSFVSIGNIISGTQPTITPSPTPIPPTATFTPTPIPPSPTPTATSVACTHTVVASSTSSLISAIVSANSASTPSTICLSGGTYSLTAVNNSDESPNGLPSITKNITIIGNNSVIERATSAPQFRIFRVASNGRLSLNNLTVRGGHAGSLSGGGIRNLGILELNTVIVENNTGNAGGGIRNNNNATFTAINSLIRNNISTTNGGGLYANNSSSTTLTNTNFLGNTTNASNGLGGAIFSNGNVFNMNGGIIQNNSARNGGGIFVNITTQAMSLNGVQFTGNTASNHGAGIYHLSGTTFSVQNGRFTSNIATNEGGAIAGDGTFTISNSNFLSNSANIGGAIHAQATSGSSIQQSCLENNTAPNTIGIFNEATIVLNAQNNFWGSAGAGGSVNANVNTNGALMACPNP